MQRRVDCKAGGGRNIKMELISIKKEKNKILLAHKTLEET